MIKIESKISGWKITGYETKPIFDSQIVLEDPMAPENEFNCSLFLYNSPNTWSVETINDFSLFSLRKYCNRKIYAENC